MAREASEATENGDAGKRKKALFDWGYAVEDSGVISCYDKSDNLLGTILANHGNWEAIKAGHDPIKEKWEDGCGNILSPHGWGQDWS